MVGNGGSPHGRSNPRCANQLDVDQRLAAVEVSVEAHSKRVASHLIRGSGAWPERCDLSDALNPRYVGSALIDSRTAFRIPHPLFIGALAKLFVAALRALRSTPASILVLRTVT